MNPGGHTAALDYRQMAAVELYRKEAERARETAKQVVGPRDRAYWSALAANWEKLAKEAEALVNLEKRESELLRAMFDVGYFPPNTLPG
jgi:hypothetical protein